MKRIAWSSGAHQRRTQELNQRLTCTGDREEAVIARTGDILGRRWSCTLVGDG